MRHICIVGSWEQFNHIIKCSKFTKEKTLRFISNDKQLYGMLNPLVFLVGNFWKLENWSRIEEQLRVIKAEIIEIRY